MNRIIPAAALLIFLASGTEASACGGWCYQFFNSIFGRQQPAPLALQAPNPPANVARGIDTIKAWGISEEETRRAFDIAYGSESFHIGIDDSYARWKETIGERTDRFVYPQGIFDNSGIKVIRWGPRQISVEIGSATNEQRARSGRAFGIERDSYVGFFARAYVAFGGRQNLQQVMRWYGYQTREFAQLRPLTHPERLERAAHYDIGGLARAFYGFVPVAVEQEDQSNFWVAYGPEYAGPQNALRLNEPGPQLQLAATPANQAPANGPQLQLGGNRNPIQSNISSNDDVQGLDDDDDDVLQGLTTSGRNEVNEKDDVLVDDHTQEHQEDNPLLKQVDP